MFLDLSAGSWSAPAVPLAIGFGRRWRGLRAATGGNALLLRGRSVHTVGMKEALWLVGVTGAGRVIQVRYVVPGRAVILAGADFVLELPPTRPPPPLGSTITAARG